MVPVEDRCDFQFRFPGSELSTAVEMEILVERCSMFFAESIMKRVSTGKLALSARFGGFQAEQPDQLWRGVGERCVGVKSALRASHRKAGTRTDNLASIDDVVKESPFNILLDRVSQAVPQAPIDITNFGFRISVQLETVQNNETPADIEFPQYGCKLVPNRFNNRRWRVEGLAAPDREFRNQGIVERNFPIFEGPRIRSRPRLSWRWSYIVFIQRNIDAPGRHEGGAYPNFRSYRTTAFNSRRN